MNRYNRIALPLAFAGLLAACASPASPASVASDEAVESPAATRSASAQPTTTPSEAALETAAPSATPHDMGEMGSGETVTVDIANFAFEPAELVIAPGTEVVFTNSDSAPHTVTAGTDQQPMPELFDSGLLEQGDTFRFVFDEPGEFAYFCERHPPMTALVVVEG